MSCSAIVSEYDVVDVEPVIELVASLKTSPRGEPSASKLSARAENSPSIEDSLLPSVWVWLYAGSGLLVRTVVYFGRGAVFLRNHLDVEEKPLSAMGFVAGGLLACVWWVICLVAWLGK